jgi:hypothetical protein
LGFHRCSFPIFFRISADEPLRHIDSLILLSAYVPMKVRQGFVELTEAELAFALEIILRSDSAAIPVLKGRGAPKDCNVRDALMRRFAEQLAGRLRSHMKCYRGPMEPPHST